MGADPFTLRVQQGVRFGVSVTVVPCGNPSTPSEHRPTNQKGCGQGQLGTQGPLGPGVPGPFITPSLGFGNLWAICKDLSPMVSLARTALLVTSLLIITLVVFQPSFTQSEVGPGSLSVLKPRNKLQDVCKRVATESGIVIVTTTNRGMLHFLENWMFYLGQLNLAQHCLIYAFDDFSYEYIEARWPGQAVNPELEELERAGMPIPREEGLLQVSNASFIRLMKARPYLILAVLRLNYSAFFSDTDIVYLTNPLLWLNDTRYQAYISIENGPGWTLPEYDRRLSPYVHPRYTRPPNSKPGEGGMAVDPPMVNCGVMFFRPGALSEEFTRKWGEASVAYPNESDQYSFNTVAHTQLYEVVEGGKGKGQGENEGAGEGNGQGSDEGKGQGQAAGLVTSMAILPVHCFPAGWYTLEVVLHGAPTPCLCTLHFNCIWFKHLKQSMMLYAGVWRTPVGAAPGLTIEATVELGKGGDIRRIDPKALRAHALPRAKDGVLLFSFLRDVSELLQPNLNDYFAPHEYQLTSTFSLFWTHIRTSGLAPHATVFTGDEVMFQQANERERGSAILLSLLSADPSAKNGTIKRPDLLPALLLQLIRFNITACYSDLRSLWFKWPFPVEPEFDVLVSYPGELAVPPGAESPRFLPLDADKKASVNLALLCVRPTISSQAFLQRWLALTQANESHSLLPQVATPNEELSLVGFRGALGGSTLNAIGLSQS